MQPAGLHRQAHLITGGKSCFRRNAGDRNAQIADPGLKQDFGAELLHHLDLRVEGSPGRTFALSPRSTNGSAR